ncbi:MAG: V-type ATP synthase subunit I [Clostridiales bacterium]|jgi:V/A-type H+-transporting ATPase subunit I|nr:V-type ATP synthase subunit I [Clostridiales bacterium]
MSIVKMSKVSLAGMLADKPAIIAKVMKLGLVEIIDYDSRDAGGELAGLAWRDGADADAAAYEGDMRRVAAAIEAIERFVPEKKPMFFSGREMELGDYRRIAGKFDSVWRDVDDVAQFDSRLAALKAEENRIRAQIETLLPWRAVDLPLESPETKSAKVAFGAAPADTPAESIEEALLLAVPESCIEEVSQDGEQRYYAAVYFGGSEEAALQALKGQGFSRLQFKEFTGTPQENIERGEGRLAGIESERVGIESRLKALAPEKLKMEVLHDYLEIRLMRSRAVGRLGRTGSAFLLEGWLPSESAKGFEEAVRAVADCHIEIAAPEKGENHPILLDNPKIVKPFEAITAMYSLPSVRDVDPNVVMAPFYFIFFGMMVGDFAYGILLSIAVGAMILKFKPKGMAGQILNMLFLGGISTAIWGAVFGSYFGNVTQIMAGWLNGTGEASPGLRPLWFDPLSDPMKLLIFSMALGGLHLFAGMAVKMYMLIKDGKVFAAIFDVGSWYVLLIGIVLIVLAPSVGMWMAIAGAAMLVLTQGRDKKNPVMKLLNGIMSLYGITGYLSDVLSYSRLLALGLATGVIAAVINTLATLNAPSPISFIIFLIIIAIGTVFNIAINALGAFVHSSRLQYVEFFSKFYEGGGEAFKPFRIKTKYVRVVQKAGIGP